MMVEDLLAILEQRAFGDLDLEAVGGKAGRRQDLQDLLRERSIAKLHRRDVDRDLEMAGPAPRLFQRLFHDTDRQRPDQARRLGDFHEGRGLEQAPGRRPPACERLESDQLARGKIDQRLEEGYELAVVDAAANVFLQRQPVGQFELQFLVEPGEAVSARSFRGVKCDVAAAQCRRVLVRPFDRPPVRWTRRHALRCCPMRNGVPSLATSVLASSSATAASALSRMIANSSPPILAQQDPAGADPLTTSATSQSN